MKTYANSAKPRQDVIKVSQSKLTELLDLSSWYRDYKKRTIYEQDQFRERFNQIINRKDEDGNI